MGWLDRAGHGAALPDSTTMVIAPVLPVAYDVTAIRATIAGWIEQVYS